VCYGSIRSGPRTLSGAAETRPGSPPIARGQRLGRRVPGRTVCPRYRSGYKQRVVDIPPWLWVTTVGIVVGLLALDYVVAARRPHRVGLTEAAAWSAVYVAVALGFGVGLWLVTGPDAAIEYYTGWAVEKSLSVDNLFVFVIIVSAFAVPPEYEQRVLLFGVALALLMRAALIALGAAAINLFSPTFLLFGMLLVVTAVMLIRHRDEDPDVDGNPLVRLARRFLPLSTDYHGGRLVARVSGSFVMTPLFLVFVAVGTTDLLFALDSIPAIFGISQDAFIVFAANAFALLGLRALYFLVEGLLARLVYLSIGLAVILCFIGVKLILLFLHEDISAAVPTVPTPVSLVVILVVLVAVIAASIVRTRAHPELRAHAGTLRRRSPERAAHGPAERDSAHRRRG
jgi:tellurite resistance protein TerC